MRDNKGQRVFYNGRAGTIIHDDGDEKYEVRFDDSTAEFGEWVYVADEDEDTHPLCAEHRRVIDAGDNGAYLEKADGTRLDTEGVDTMGDTMFERFTLSITLDDAQYATHPGPCDQEVAELVARPAIRSQLDAISDADLRSELSEYGAWDAAELADRADNEQRIIWIAAGNIAEEV